MLCCPLCWAWLRSPAARSPQAPAEGLDDLLCLLDTEGVDADADSLTFTGASTTTLPGDTVPASATAEGQVWTCSLTPHGGLDDGQESSAAV